MNDNPTCPPQRIGHEFMLQTRDEEGPSDQMLERPQPPLELAPDPNLPLIPLPTPAVDVPDIRLSSLIEARSSIRKYAAIPLALVELSYLLWCTQGVQNIAAGCTWRTVPSAGARHAFETYILANRVEGLAPGIYHFIATEHALQHLPLPKDAAERLSAACYRQSMVLDSAVAFIWTAVAYRMTWRYRERGYRYLHLDAGHVCQNLYLAAESIGCGTCAIAAFDDDALNQLLGLDGDEQFGIYLATAGKK